MGGGLVDNAPDSPELSSRALEIEHDESDSDSDGEEERKPSSGEKKADRIPTEEPVSSAKNQVAESSGAISVESKQTEPISFPTPAPGAEVFDDAFGIKRSDNKNATATNGFDDAFGSKPAVTETTAAPAQAKSQDLPPLA